MQGELHGGGESIAFAGEFAPRPGQLAPQLRNSSLAYLELAGGLRGAVAETEVFGDAAIAAGELIEPVLEVHTKRDDFRHGRVAGVLDDRLFPAVFQLVELVEPLDDDVLQPLTVASARSWIGMRSVLATAAVNEKAHPASECGIGFLSKSVETQGDQNGIASALVTDIASATSLNFLTPPSSLMTSSTSVTRW